MLCVQTACSLKHNHLRMHVSTVARADGSSSALDPLTQRHHRHESMMVTDK